MRERCVHTMTAQWEKRLMVGVPWPTLATQGVCKLDNKSRVPRCYSVVYVNLFVYQEPWLGINENLSGNNGPKLNK